MAAFRMVDMTMPAWGVLSAAVPCHRGAGLIVVATVAASAVRIMGVISVGGLCVVIGAVEGNVLTPWLMSRVG
jgi:predicted PurR-regulated permease PerM